MTSVDIIRIGRMTKKIRKPSNCKSEYFGEHCCRYNTIEEILEEPYFNDEKFNNYKKRIERNTETSQSISSEMTTLDRKSMLELWQKPLKMITTLRNFKTNTKSQKNSQKNSQKKQNNFNKIIRQTRGTTIVTSRPPSRKKTSNSRV